MHAPGVQKGPGRMNRGGGGDGKGRRHPCTLNGRPAPGPPSNGDWLWVAMKWLSSSRDCPVHWKISVMDASHP